MPLWAMDTERMDRLDPNRVATSEEGRMEINMEVANGLGMRDDYEQTKIPRL